MNQQVLIARLPAALRAFSLCFAAVVATPAHAMFLSGDALDTAADWLAIFVIIIVPVVVVVLFWLVHILPEKIAHKRHHPQRDAIQTLCLLSLVFGGMLWPVAWLWAYTKPVGYRMAYGTERHDDYYEEMAGKLREGALSRAEIVALREELDSMESKGALPASLRALKDELERIRAAERPARTPAASEGKA